MAYTINSFTGVNGDITIEDGTINQTTSLKLIGKNYAGYGELQNENFYHLLENFAGTGEPGRKTTGMLWYDASATKLRYYDGQRFRPASGAEVDTSEPTGQSAGDFWFDSQNDQIFVYNGTEYILVGPQSSSQGQVTQLETGTAKVQGENTLKQIIRGYINGEVVFVISGGINEFLIDSAEPENDDLVGFTVIKPGITLKNTPADGLTTGNQRFWGTASSAERLVVAGQIFDADEFVLKSTPEMTGQANIRVDGQNGGLTIGTADNYKIYNSGNVGYIANEGGTDIVFRANGSEKFKVSNDTFMPVANGVYDLGESGTKFRTIYANSIDGLATKASQIEYDGDGSGLYARATIANNNLTIPVRDSSGTVFATTFDGVSTKAQYADLAEKYTTDQEYEVGTVMMVCEHGEHETEACTKHGIAIGVISAEPAYLMNSEIDGQAIGLKGRVPVKVVGAVKKGQPVYASNSGVASIEVAGSLVGVALESNDSDDVKLVECVLKV
jgi:hypothetical protein